MWGGATHSSYGHSSKPLISTPFFVLSLAPYWTRSFVSFSAIFMFIIVFIFIALWPYCLYASTPFVTSLRTRFSTQVYLNAVQLPDAKVNHYIQLLISVTVITRRNDISYTRSATFGYPEARQRGTFPSKLDYFFLFRIPEYKLLLGAKCLNTILTGQEIM